MMMALYVPETRECLVSFSYNWPPIRQFKQIHKGHRGVIGHWHFIFDDHGPLC